MNELEMIGIFPEREGFRREKVGGFIFVKPLEMKQMRDHVDPGPLLVLGLHDVPRAAGHVGVHEHLVLGPAVVLPLGE